jgi:hypothetical protein
MLFEEYNNTILNKNEKQEYQELLQQEVDKIILNEWDFLKDNWKKIK